MPFAPQNIQAECFFNPSPIVTLVAFDHLVLKKRKGTRINKILKIYKVTLFTEVLFI